MTLTIGDSLPDFSVQAIDGSTVSSADMRGGPCLLAFFRFARCPFCNLRLHRLIQSYGELQVLHPDFRIVAIFDSPLSHLQTSMQRHAPPFIVAADPEHRAYSACAIRYSLWGVIKGMVLRMPTLIKAMAKGYLPTSMRGRMTTMPADFLLDAQGIIRHAHYGRDEGDHCSVTVIKDFVAQQAAHSSSQTVSG